MDSSGVAAFVVLIVVVNVGALVVLAVLSYLGSVWALRGLAALDRWMDASQRPIPAETGLGREPRG